MNVGDDPVLATISPSPARLWIAIAMLAMLAGILLTVAVQMPRSAILLQIMVFAVAGVCIWGIVRIYASTQLSIELTRSEIRDTSGQVIARIEDIAGIERGMLAFKPTNGFLVRTKSPAPRAWAPGIWWRLGRFNGVGGVTYGHQGKAMADHLAILLAERDGEI